MDELVVRDLNPRAAAWLEVRARSHGRTLEEEAKSILEEAVPLSMGDERTYGYSIQGILYEIADPDYLSPKGRIRVGVDARDGRQWVCYLDKTIAPDNLQDLWRAEVLVTGTATFQPSKAVLDVTTFMSLPGVSDPVRAMEELLSLCGREFQGSGSTAQAGSAPHRTGVAEALAESDERQRRTPS